MKTDITLHHTSFQEQLILKFSQSEQNKAEILRQPWLGLVVLTGFFNFVDLDYTLFALPTIPGSYEQNPLFWKMLQTPPVAVAFKVIVIPLLLFLMYRCRESLVSRIGMWLCFAVYAFNFFCQVAVLVRFLLL